MRHAYIVIDTVAGGIVSVHTNSPRAWGKIKKMAEEKRVDPKGRWSVSKWQMDAPPEVRTPEIRLLIKSLIGGAFIDGKSDEELEQMYITASRRVETRQGGSAAVPKNS